MTSLSKSGNDFTTQTDESNGKTFYGWVILVTGFLLMVTGYSFYYSFGVFFEDLQIEFGSTRASIALIASIMTSLNSGLAFPAGWVTDKYGPRIIVAIGGFLFCCGLIISSRANSVEQLYIFLGAMVGCGISSFFNPYIVTLSRWFLKKRGLVQGIYSGGASVGMMLGAPILARLIINYGWRTTVFIIGIASIAIFAASAYLVRKSPEEKGLMPYGSMGNASKVNNRGAKTTSTPDMTLKEAMRTKDFWLLFGRGLTLPLVVFMVTTHLVSYAKDTGMSPSSAALIMTIVGAASVVGKVGAGHLADRHGAKRIQALCTAILACSMFWLSTEMSAQMLHVFAIVYGLSFGGAFSTSSVLVAAVFGVAHMGKIYGFLALGGAVGGVIGPWLAGNIFDTTGSYSMAFLIAACIGIVMTVLILLVGKAGLTKVRR